MRVGAERGGAPVGVSQQPAAADADLPQSGVIAPKVQTAPRAHQGFQEGSAGSRCTPEVPGHPLWTPCFQLVGHQHNPIFSTQIPSLSREFCPTVWTQGARIAGTDLLVCRGVWSRPSRLFMEVYTVQKQFTRWIRAARGIVAFQHSQKCILSMPGHENLGTHHFTAPDLSFPRSSAEIIAALKGSRNGG